uniref:Uncharacterized protein n=1 Tax=Pyxicephalus adspersus TaxID=30357 RepID=A0AAV3AZB3_PYXAD|nr:TPA: hypothetical protein GDO54_000566 [Pyxicephalus adspersus]
MLKIEKNTFYKYTLEFKDKGHEAAIYMGTCFPRDLLYKMNAEGSEYFGYYIKHQFSYCLPQKFDTKWLGKLCLQTQQQEKEVAFI